MQSTHSSSSDALNVILGIDHTIRKCKTFLIVRHITIFTIEK